MRFKMQQIFKQQVKRQYINAAIAATALLVISNPVFAQDIEQPEVVSRAPDMMAGEAYLAALPPPGDPAPGFCEGLNLSDDQLERIVDLRNQYKVNTAQKAAEMKVKLHEMMHLLSQPAVDTQKVMSLQGEMNVLRDSLSNSRASFLIDLSGVFTADQKKQVHHMMLMHILKMGGFMPCGPGRPGAMHDPCCPTAPGVAVPPPAHSCPEEHHRQQCHQHHHD